MPISWQAILRSSHWQRTHLSGQTPLSSSSSFSSPAACSSPGTRLPAASLTGRTPVPKPCASPVLRQQQRFWRYARIFFSASGHERPLPSLALQPASPISAPSISYLRRKLSDKKLLPQSDSHAQTDSPHVLLASKDRRLPCERHSWWQLPHWLPWLSPKSLS